MSYSLLQWLMFFYIYCFIGWCFESAYVSLKERRFVNRGFLKLPMLPIYGSGAIAILIVTIPVRDNLWLVWLLGMISATFLELVTGAVMEVLFKVKYWDYSNQRFNYKGYICLSSSIAWGFLSLILTEVIHEPVELFVLGTPVWLLMTLVSVISVLFVSDFIVSFKAAWDLRRLLEKLALLRTQTSERWDEIREEAVERLEAVRLEYARKRKAEYERLSDFRAFFIRRLLRDNPYAASGKFGEVFDELREDIHRRHEELREDMRQKREAWKKRK